MVSLPQIHCREIHLTDTEGVLELRIKGFATYRDRTYWLRAMRRLSEHPTPPGFPKYGYLLASNGVPVGVILLIFSSLFCPRRGYNSLQCIQLVRRTGFQGLRGNARRTRGKA